MRVFIYYNLHRKCWSVKALEGESKGRVIAHCDNVYITECFMKVSQAGRLRVIKEKRKNVHAGIIGEWTNDLMVIAKYIGYSHKGKTITYNPYIHTSFVEKETGNRVYSANCVTLNGRTVTAYN